MSVSTGSPGVPPPRLSVIVPAYQCAASLRRCLDAIAQSDLSRHDWELLVVDDGSTDETSAIAETMADVVLRTADGPRGPAHARNVGAHAARGAVLVFVDADVLVAPSTLRGFASRLDADAELTAVFGSYDDRPTEPGLVSQYRNLLHHRTHTVHAGVAETFWAGCGAIRRTAFLEAGGFDAARYPRPQVEDIELGYRLCDGGARILLAPDLTGTHLKRWTLGGMVRTDFADRAVPWTRLLLERRLDPSHAPLNLSWLQRLFTASAGIAMLSLPLALLTGTLGWGWIGLACLVVVVIGNLPLFGFLASRRGWQFALGTVPLHLVHYAVSVCGAGWGALRHITASVPRPALTTGVLLLALHAALAWSIRSPTLATGGDDAMLLALARALRGGSYAELWTLGAPTHAMYPPGYPVLLAFLGATGPAALPLALALGIALSTAMLALTALLAARVSPWLGVALLLVGATNPQVLGVTSRVSTEPAFGALLATMLVLAAASGDGARRWGLTAACGILAALTRSIGVALIAALLLEFALRRRGRSVMVLAAVSALTVGAWLAWTASAPRLDAGSSYIADALYTPPAARPAEAPMVTPPSPSLVSVLAERVRRNASGYLRWTLPVAIAQPMWPGTPTDNVVWLAITLGAGGIGFGWWARRQRIVALAVMAYVGVLLMWPYQYARFLAPIVPLLLLGLLTGVWWAGRRWASPRVAWVGVWTLAGVLTLSGAQAHLVRRAEIAGCDRDGEPRRSLACVGPKQRDFFAAIEVARDSSAADAPVLASKPATVWTFSGRPSLPLDEALRARDPDAFVALLQDTGVELVLLNHVHIQQWALAPMLEARCNAFALVRAFETHAAVLRVLPRDAPDRSPAQSAAACDAIRNWASTDWMREVDGSRLGPW